MEDFKIKDANNVLKAILHLTLQNNILLKTSANLNIDLSDKTEIEKDRIAKDFAEQYDLISKKTREDLFVLFGDLDLNNI